MGSIGVPTSHHLYPSFAPDITTAPLVSISLSKLQSGDEAESKDFFDAARNLGFFYMKLEGSALGESIINGAERLQALQQQFFKRPNEEKEEFARAKIDPFFGYRKVELKMKDDDGNEMRNEMYNMRKDDFLGNCEPLPCHPIVTENWETFKQYVRDCRAAIDLMISQLERHLEIADGALAQLHRITSRSGDHVRFIQSAAHPWNDELAKQGEHTDFGTLTILMNWLGGLQIRHPDSGEWVYVKPIPGSAIVNLGDACVKFTAGILRSNVHRVVPPAPPQNGMVRNSLVYFSRPEDAVILKRLKGGLIDQQPQDAREGEEEMTAQEWTLRRSVGDMRGVYTHKGGLELKASTMVEV